MYKLYGTAISLTKTANSFLSLIPTKEMCYIIKFRTGIYNQHTTWDCSYVNTLV